MRSVVAVVVALPWVVWALPRTLGVELSYPLVALIAFTPYAALTSPVPVVAALVLRSARAADRGDDEQPVARPGRPARGAARRARARRASRTATTAR